MMSVARHQSQYDAALSPEVASQNASHHNQTTPLGFDQNKISLHGTLGSDLEQMYFDSVGNLSILNISGPQNYTTGADYSQLHSRDDDPLAAVHHESFRHQERNPPDAAGNNVEGYHQVPRTQPWSSYLAAEHSASNPRNTQQRARMTGPYHTPTRQSGFMPSDEGYFTNQYQLSQQDTRSVRSGRSNSIDRSFRPTGNIPRSIPESQRIRSNSQGKASNDSMASNQTGNRRAAKSEPEASDGPIKCPQDGCSWSGKTPSDLKKHAARHKLAHVCNADNCTKGFATVNDLVRHQATVHKIRPAGVRMYRCFGEGCKNPEKDWPRKDNFKSHLVKTHRNEDTVELLRKSDEWWNSLNPGDLTGAGIQHMATASPSAQQSTGLYAPFQQSVAAHYMSSTTSSEYQQTTPLTTAHLPMQPYMTRDGASYSNPIPGTSQYMDQVRWQQQQLQRGTESYLDDVSVAPEFQMQDVSSGRQQGMHWQAALNQPRNHPHRASVITVPQTTRRQNHGSRQMSFSHSHGNMLDLPSSDTRMQRSVSGDHNNMLAAQRPEMNQHANTVADPSFLEQERIDLMQEWDAQPSVTNDFHNNPDILSQVGQAAELPSQMFTNNMIPLIAVHGPGSGDPEEFNVENLRQFIALYQNQVKNERDRVAIQSALQTLESTGGAPSSDISLTDGQVDTYIGDFINDGKTVFKCVWPNCKSEKACWNNRSELKKHVKRHIRQYGCTFDHCYRRFGSKSDWIRHETKRHSQQDIWRCVMPLSRPAPGIQPCRRLFYTRELFEAHLESAHKLSRKSKPQEVNLQVTNQHINSNFQPQYWCGFCKRIEKLPGLKGPTGIHARYDHIAHHFIDEDKSIDDWISPDGIYSKGQRQKKRLDNPNRNIDENSIAEDRDEENTSPDLRGSDESSSSDDASAPAPVTPSKVGTTATHAQQRQSLIPNPGQSLQHARKRSASAAGLQSHPQPRKKRANAWRCHECHWEMTIATSPACTNIDCNHAMCGRCFPFYREEREAM